MILALENYEDLKDEVREMSLKHFDEAGLYTDKVKLNVNEDALTSPYYYFFTARDEEELIGYVGYFVQPAQHCADTLIALHDMIYTAEEHRSKDVASSLLSFAEEIFKDINVKIMTVTLKRESSLPEKLGFEKDSISYTKYIGD